MLDGDRRVSQLAMLCGLLPLLQRSGRQGMTAVRGVLNSHPPPILAEKGQCDTFILLFLSQQDSAATLEGIAVIQLQIEQLCSANRFERTIKGTGEVLPN